MIPLPSPTATANERALSRWHRADVLAAVAGTDLVLEPLPVAETLQVFKNGLLLAAAAYTLAGAVLTITAGYAIGDRLSVLYWFRQG